MIDYINNKGISQHWNFFPLEKYSKIERDLKSLGKDSTMYRCEKILKMLFQFTQQNNHLRKGYFNKFHFKQEIAKTREEFLNFFSSQKHKF